MDDGEVLRELAETSRQDLGMLLAAAARTVNAAVLERISASGHPIRLSQFAVFAALEAGGSRISALAEHSGHSRQAMSALVREVEALGYVETSPDPVDGRATIVRLTPLGVAFCREAITASRELSAAYGDRLGSDTVAALRDSLRRVADSDGSQTA
jgi:DNA-binding MarR family transcriptional regulator